MAMSNTTTKARAKAKAALRARAKVAKPAAEVFIPGDPKRRTERQWRAVKPTTAGEKASAKWRAELVAIADHVLVLFPRLGNLMAAYNNAAYRLDCALGVEAELDEAARSKDGKIGHRENQGAISSPLDDIEIAALMKLLRHRAGSITEVQLLGRYLTKLRERNDWEGVGDSVGALLEGMAGTDTTRPHPDAGLLALKLTFDEFSVVYRNLLQAHDRGEDVGKPLDDVYAKLTALSKRIIVGRASTIEGLLVKNAAFEFMRTDDPEEPRYDLGDTNDMRLVSSIMRDLGRIAGPPPAYPDDHPWIAVRRLSVELSAALARIDDGPVMALIKPATEPDAIAWGDLSIYGDMLPLKPVTIEDCGDQLHGDIDALRELVRTISWDLANLSHVHPTKPGERHEELDKVGRLVRVLETVADKLVIDVDEHVTHLYGVNGANKTNFNDVEKARREPPLQVVGVAQFPEGSSSPTFRHIGDIARDVVGDAVLRSKPADANTH